MKVRISIFIALLALSCTAAFGQTVSLGFLDHDKQTQYCDFVQITVTNRVVTGPHFAGASQSCAGVAPNGVIAGLIAAIPSNSGLPVTGTVATFADNTYDNQQGYMGACQCSEYYVTKLRPSTAAEIQNNVFGWALYTNFGGTTTLTTFGFTTKQLSNNDQNSKHTFDFQFK